MKLGSGREWRPAGSRAVAPSEICLVGDELPARQVKGAQVATH